MNNAVVGLGEILWDVLPDRKVLGGAPANFAYHVSQFGYNGYAVSAIGNDLLGKEIMESLAEKNLNYAIEATDYPTGTVKVTLNTRGIPEYEICEDVAWDNIPFTERLGVLASHTRVVSFGSLAQRNEVSRNTIRRFLKETPENSLKIFDINLRQHFYTKEIIHDSLSMSNILKINDEEILLISKLYNFGIDQEQDVYKRLMDMYDLELLILTRGTEGSYVFTQKETSFQPTPKVHVADTVGAGDSFTAAFVASYIHGDRITDAHKLAVEVSAYVCTQHGAMPKIPDAYTELFKNR